MPALYKVYSVDIRSLKGEAKTLTILIDAGSDNDYIQHNKAAKLGLVGTPFS